MSQSRRNFTKEFKEAAIRRLELGASVAELRSCPATGVSHRSVGVEAVGIDTVLTGQDHATSVVVKVGTAWNRAETGSRSERKQAQEGSRS